MNKADVEEVYQYYDDTRKPYPSEVRKAFGYSDEAIKTIFYGYKYAVPAEKIAGMINAEEYELDDR